MTHRPRFDLYVAACLPDGGIYRFCMEGDAVHLCGVTPADRPMYLMLQGQTMYALLRQPFAPAAESGLAGCRVAPDGSLGALSAPQTTKGEVACHLCALDGSIYCVNYSSGSVIGMPDTLVTHTGHSIHPDRQAMPHPHYICPTPDGAYLCVADLGLDRLLVYDRQLRLVSSAAVPAGHGARHLAFAADGRTAFCVNELASTVTAFSYEAGQFTPLSTVCALPEDFSGESTAAAIRVDGSEIFVSHRGHNSIARLTYADGQWGGCSWTNCGGRTPRDFALAGEYLICANQDSDNVVVFRRTGAALIKLTEFAVPAPVCVLAVQRGGSV